MDIGHPTDWPPAEHTCPASILVSPGVQGHAGLFADDSGGVCYTTRAMLCGGEQEWTTNLLIGWVLSPPLLLLIELDKGTYCEARLLIVLVLEDWLHWPWPTFIASKPSSSGFAFHSERNTCSLSRTFKCHLAHAQRSLEGGLVFHSGRQHVP